MAVDQIRKLQAAEELLKQGRADEALAELQRLAEDSPNDLLTLNRMGDMLSRQGRVEDALGYYREIADKFASAGYLHKAVAILKKMLRLDPENTDVLATIGRLYIRQKLPVEGGRYLLSSADRFLEAKQFANARAVYEELVVTDPQNPLHRARLAETMAAEGDGETAGRELVRLADSLRSEGRWEDAERSYRRAGELCPEWHDPILGVSACLTARGKQDEALAILESAVANGRRALLGELVLRSEMAARHERVDELLRQSSLHVTPETFEHLFLYSREAGTTDGLWDRLDPIFAGWPRAGAADRLVELYEALVGIEDGGHQPALDRLFGLLEASPDRQAFVPSMERLYRGLKQKAMHARAEAVYGWLRATAPQSPVLRAVVPPAPAAAGGEPAVEAEAPAVPLNRTDEEFVTGRLTQAEILEKYSLVDQAVQQVRDVVTRFPGHVEAQKRLVKLLRHAGDKSGHAEALARLAIACRAAGNLQAARVSAAEAQQTKLLDASTTATLEALGLIGAATARPAAPAPASKAKPAKSAPAAAPAAAAAIPLAASDAGDEKVVMGSAVSGAVAQTKAPAPAAAPPVAAAPAKPPPPARAPAPGKTTAPTRAAATKAAVTPPKVAKVQDVEEVEMVLDLDGDGVVLDLDADEPVAAAPRAAAVPMPAPSAPAAAVPAAKVPAAEMIEEIEFYLGQDRVEEARKRIDTLVELGYEGEALERLAVAVARKEAELSAPPDTLAPVGPETADPADDDLRTIAAALESELDDAVEAVEPDAGSEQSVEDVFAAFREKVNEEIGAEDYRTHYDLGIGYKEMGLLEEALAEFEVSLRCSELRQESHVMMGMIRRELGRVEEAVQSYRAAAAESDPADTVPLRYELADLLAQTGALQEALAVMRQVCDVDPGYRDVQERIHRLETGSPASPRA